LDQLARLNRILSLKDLGLPLDKITQILEQKISIGEIQTILDLKQIELKEQIRDIQRRLARVEARLEHMKKD
jgi:DNA-binding transcriptional MerR regulator